MPLAALFAAEGALTSAQMAALLKNLLQLPRELTQLLLMLAQTGDKTGQAMLNALLSEELQIPLEAFQALLQTQGRQAQEKLLKLLQNTPMGFTQSGPQLGDLLQALSKLSENPSGGGKGLDALQNTLALYLPYYPLQAPQQFSLRYQPEPEGTDGQPQEGMLIVFLQTITLGALKITIGIHAGIPDVVVEHHLPGSMQAALERQMRDSLKAEHLPHAQLFFVGKQGGDGKKDSPEEHENGESKNMGTTTHRREVSILPGQGVSAVAVLAAYAIIRTIFDLDNRNQPEQSRAML